MSLRKAINDMCRWCIYDPLSGLGNWRKQVEGCTSPECPLFPYRPKSRPRKTLNGILATDTPETGEVA
jgi:hypothetical protein